MFKIRNALTSDITNIARIQVDSYRNAYQGIFPPSYLDQFSYQEQEKDWLDILNNLGQDILLVAVSENDHILGYSLARPGENSFPEYDAEIIALHVRHEFQHKGIGAALLQAVAETLIKRGCATVMLWTLEKNRIREWYEKLGGVIIGQKKFEVDGWDVHEVAYGWNPIQSIISH